MTVQPRISPLALTMSRRAFSASLMLALGGLAACGGKAGGGTLRIGDQGKALQRPVELSGEGRNPPLPFEWTTFNDGPNMNAAFLAGALDAGMMGDTPALFASAAGADVVAVALGNIPPNTLIRLVAPPGSGIRTVADLRGKRVAFTKSSSPQGYLLLALDEAGLAHTDIVPVDVPIVSLALMLESNSADAAVLGGALLSSYLARNPGAVLLDVPVAGYTSILASRASIEDAGKRAALLDFTQRAARAGRWIGANLDIWRKEYYENVLHQDPETARAMIAQQGESRLQFGPVPDEAHALWLRQARVLAKAGLLPNPDPVANRLFDPAINRQFNQAIAEALA